MRIAEEPHKLKPLQVATKEKIIKLEQGHSTYEIERNEAVRIQIRLAIQNHFVKQMNILRTGRKIKTLTLFFIDSVDKVREGYFALDAKKSVVEIDGWDSSVDEDNLKIRAKSQEDIDRGISLILEKKDELISFEEPLAFIFSHSALREGWDNPNVFTLCTLKSGGSEIAKKQEIGRGLRLPVDITGNRCLDRRINEFTVIANYLFDRVTYANQRFSQ